MKLKSRQIALGGVLTALAVVVVSMGSLIPLATFCAPILAMVVLLPVRAECGTRTALAAYGAVSILPMLLVPDREAALFYVFFGCYPLIQPALGRLRSRLARLLCKLAFCNLALVGMYSLLIFVFQLDAVVAEVQTSSLALVVCLWVLGNVTFLLLDKALFRLSLLWERQLRKRFFPKR